MQSMGVWSGLVLLPLGVAAGWLAGAVAARRAVRQELEALRAPVRVPIPVRVAPPVAAPVPEVLSEETLAILTAVVAAVLGKKARIRGARLMPAGATAAWAQQGRASIQASHNLAFARHGR
jgi:hypothetical protein